MSASTLQRMVWGWTASRAFTETEAVERVPKVKKVKICHFALFVIHCFKSIQTMAFFFIGSELLTENNG